MKSILYVGATLMIGASIYGFVDYKETSQKDEFTGMYTEEKIKPDVKVVTDVVAQPEKKSETVLTKKEPVKKAVSKKKVAMKEEPLPAIHPIAEDALLTISEPGEIETVSVDETIAADKAPVKVKKRKKINSKIFSRAPIREEEEIVVDKVKVSKKDK